MDVFAALADQVRRDLLRRLATGPGRVVDLAADHEISRPAVSRHLKLLSEAGLVSADDHGRERHYRLQRSGLTPVMNLLTQLELAPRFDESALAGLDLEVRRTVRERADKDRPRYTQTTPNEETA